MREAIEKNEILVLCDSQGKQKKYNIADIVGFGATCIVYDAFYRDEFGLPHYVKLKECYPLNGTLERRENGNIKWIDKETEQLKKEQFINTYKQHVALQSRFEFVNTTCKVSDTLYRANDTYYYEMESDNGKSFDKDIPDSLHKILKNILTLSKTIEKYHELGFLHLDIKPQNFKVIPETDELVKLFDFDSLIQKENITKGNVEAVAYTNSWAAPEVKQGKIRLVAETADVYSVGMILFFAIFKRAMDITDRLNIGDFNYCESELFENVNPIIRRLLNHFFAKTINSSPKKRYKSMEEVCVALKEMITVTEPGRYYLCTYLPSENTNFVGRSTELETMKNMMRKSNLLVLTGIGGIGKTELALKYARYHTEFDAVVYAKVQHNRVEQQTDIEHLISNDEIFSLANYTYTGNIQEKFKLLKQVVTKRTLIILDDVKDFEDQYLHNLLGIDAKFIITTRGKTEDIWGRESILEIGNLDIVDSRVLFKKSYQRVIDDEQSRQVDSLLELFDNYTLIIPLLAKVMQKNSILPSVMLEKTRNNRFNDEFGEKITALKDGKIRKETIYGHMKALFDLSNFDNDEKAYLCTLALFSGTFVDKVSFAYLCEKNYDPEKEATGIENCDIKMSVINKLIDLGWISYNDKIDMVYLHDVLCDFVIKELKPSYSMCSVFYDNYLKKLNYIEENEENVYVGIISKRAVIGLAINLLKCLDFRKQENANYLIDVLRSIGYIEHSVFQTALLVMLVEIDKMNEYPLDLNLFYLESWMLFLVTSLEQECDMEKIEQAYDRAIVFANTIKDWSKVRKYQGKEHYLLSLSIDVCKYFYPVSISLFGRKVKNEDIRFWNKIVDNFKMLEKFYNGHRKKLIREKITFLQRKIKEGLKEEKEEKIVDNKDGDKDVLEKIRNDIQENPKIPMRMKLSFQMEISRFQAMFTIARIENLKKRKENDELTEEELPAVDEFLETVTFPIYKPLCEHLFYSYPGENKWDYVRELIWENDKELDSYDVIDYLWQMCQAISTQKDFICYFDLESKEIREVLEFMKKMNFTNKSGTVKDIVYKKENSNLFVCLLLKQLSDICGYELSLYPEVWDEMAVQAYLHGYSYFFLQLLNNYCKLVEKGILRIGEGFESVMVRCAHLAQRMVQLEEPLIALKILLDIFNVLENNSLKGNQSEELLLLYDYACGIAKDIGEGAVYYNIFEKRKELSGIKFGQYKNVVFTDVNKNSVKVFNLYIEKVLNCKSISERDELLDEIEGLDELPGKLKQLLINSLSKGTSFLEYVASGFEMPIFETIDYKELLARFEEFGCLEASDLKDVLIVANESIFQQAISGNISEELLKHYYECLQDIEKPEDNPFTFILVAILPCALYKANKKKEAKKFASMLWNKINFDKLDGMNLVKKSFVIPYIIRLSDCLYNEDDSLTEDIQSKIEKCISILQLQKKFYSESDESFAKKMEKYFYTNVYPLLQQGEITE